MQILDSYGRTESSETLEKKSNMDIASLENSKNVNLSYSLAKQVQTNGVEKGLGDRNKCRKGLEMEGVQNGLRRNSILY